MGIPPVRPYPMLTEEELPVNSASWKVDPQRAVLLVHDMQRYFVDAFEAGTSPVRELLVNTVALRDRCAELGIPVAFTAQPGGMTERQRGLLRDFWGPGMTTGPEQQRIVEELAPADGDRVFTKWRYSAFQRSDLLEHLRALGRDQVVVCGVYAHIGCLMTAVEAFSHDLETFLVADAVADFTPEFHRWALDYAAARCAVTLTTAAVLNALPGAQAGS